MNSYDETQPVEKSTAKLVLKIGWWVGNVVTVIVLLWLLFFGIAVSREYDVPGLFILLILLAILSVLFQVISYKGLKYVPDSTAWNIFFLIIGVLSLGGIMGILYLIGAILGLVERNQKYNPAQVITANKAAQTVDERLKQLRALRNDGTLTEAEFEEAKKKILNEL